MSAPTDAIRALIDRWGRNVISSKDAMEDLQSILDDCEDAGRPRVVCLCGSTRFIETFATTTWELEREGFIVLGCVLLPSWYCPVADHFGEHTGTKEQCDELHKRKIDLADEILVLNVDGYIGDSTRSEIEYANAHGKPVRYLESKGASHA